MGLFDNLFKRKYKKPSINQRDLLYQFTKANFGGYTMINNPYKNKVVRSCVNFISTQIATTTLEHHYKNVDGIITTVKNGIARLLTSRPNDKMTAFNFWQKTVNMGLLKNDSYVWIVRDKKTNEPIEFIPITSSSERMLVADGHPEFTFIEFNLAGGNKMILADEDILHFRFQFCENDYFGDDSDPLIEIVSIDSDIWKSVINWSKNSAVLRGILTANGVLKDEDIKKTNESFKKMFLDTENSGGFLTLDSKFTFNPLHGSTEGIDHNYLNQLKNAIYEYFGVNEKLLNSTASPEEIQTFYKIRLEPIYTMLEQELANKLLTERELGFEHKYLFLCNSIEHLNARDKVATMTYLTNLGAVTRNEVRIAFGYTPIPDGDVLVYSKNFAEVDGSGDKKEEVKEDKEDKDIIDVEDEEKKEVKKTKVKETKTKKLVKGEKNNGKE